MTRSWSIGFYYLSIMMTIACQEHKHYRCEKSKLSIAFKGIDMNNLKTTSSSNVWKLSVAEEKRLRRMMAEFLGIRRDLGHNSRYSHQCNWTPVGVTRGLNFTLNQYAADTRGHTRHNKSNTHTHQAYIHTENKINTHIT